MKTKQAKIITTISVLMLGLVFGFQNCGKKLATQTANDVSTSPDSIVVERGEMSAPEQSLLFSVLGEYSKCDSIGSTDQRNSCMRSALETSATGVQKTAVAAPIDAVCYVVGPACKSSPEGVDPEDALKLQACRMAAVQDGLSLDNLNQLMIADPLGYAELINAKCLYTSHQCVVAVRCINRADATIGN